MELHAAPSTLEAIQLFARTESILLDPVYSGKLNLEMQGTECLVLACTELSVVTDELSSGLSVYDAAEILAINIVA